MLPASNHKAAKERLRRFFDDPKIERRQVPALINKLSEGSDVYVFGGAVRDISLFGGSRFIGDVDIVVSTFNQKRLINVLQSYDAEKNKFGGYRLQIGRWKFDIWEASETWAYKVGAVREKTYLSLLETTFFNWDAVVFDAYHSKLHHGPDYFNHLADKYLELILEENPNMLGAFVRALRMLGLSDEIIAGPKLSMFLKRSLADIADVDILTYEASSFGSNSLTPALLTEVRKNAELWHGQDRYRWREKKQGCLFERSDSRLNNLA